jgi:prepilin-type N-terminal cleavage/methylation domain-containing protein
MGAVIAAPNLILDKQPLMRDRMKTRKGFTLVEVMVVIIILSIVSTITLFFLVNSLRIYTMTANQKTLLDEGKLALERMCRDLRDASTVTVPASGGSGNSITFTRTHATAQDVASERITFHQMSSALEKVKTSPSVTRPMVSNVSSFRVTRGASNDEIKLELTLSLGSGEKVTLQTKVYPKNLGDDMIYKNFRLQDSGGNFTSWQEEIGS